MGSVITVSQDQYEMVRGKAQSSLDILISGNQTTEGDIYIIPFISNNYYWTGSSRDPSAGFYSWIFDLGDVDRGDRILIDYPLGDLSEDELDQLWDVSKIFEAGSCIWIDGYYQGDPLVSNGDSYATLFSNGFTSYGNHPESIELAWITGTGEVRDPTIESSQFGLIDLSQLDLNAINGLTANQFLSSYGDLITSRSDIIAAPLITGPTGSTGDSTDNISIEENNTAIYTFKSDQPVIWSLSGGEDVSKFAINSLTGAISFTSAPDYETPIDNDSNNTYVVVVRATDAASNTSDQTLTVKVIDVSEKSPVTDGTKVAEVDTSYVADPKGFASINAPAPVIVNAYEVGTETTLDSIKDFDGNLHAGDNLEETASSYKYQGMLDVNGDGVFEAIFTNKESKRWVTAKVDSTTGQIDFDDNGEGGGTRVVGIYADPLIAEGADNGGFLSDGVTPAPANFGVSEEERYVEVNGENIDRLALNSQVRFQNDLDIDNLSAKHSGDYDSDGVSEVYWKTNDGTAYLRALMHDDGNIRYANYQSEEQMSEYLTAQGHESVIPEII